MPPVVARQWQVLRGAPATIGTLYRPLRLSRPACLNVTLRSYAQQSNQNEEKFRQPLPLHGAILIPNSIPVAQPANFINYIRPLTRDRVKKDTFCVFLVTPSFAPWLLKDDDFLEKALLRVYRESLKRGNRKTSKLPQIQVLCAVVDKLPAGRSFGRGTTLEDEISHRAKEPPVAEAGFEGIAYVTLPHTASESSMAPPASEKGAIDFILNEYMAGDNKFSDLLRLPLANTVFQTGTPITMTQSWWQPRGHKGTGWLELSSKKNISHHGIRIVERNKSVDSVISALSIPLVPLTVPRHVEGCMGNIIRRIVNSQGTSVTASSELEEVVPKFFKSRGEPPQATTAWALVMPPAVAETMKVKTRSLLASLTAESEHGEMKRDELWECLWRSDPPSWNTLVSTALTNGARLHRVLSGGGGWGKKAGLLSLDPVPTSGPTEQPGTGDFPSLLSDPEDFASTLIPVINDGDSIQFFTSPSPKIDTDADQMTGLEKLTLLPKKNAWGWEFGTIPSTVDSMPGGSWQHAILTSRKISEFRNTFGALAEGGMTLTRRLEANNGGISPSVSTTMVDVPFSRFWAVEVADKVGSIEDVGEPENQIHTSKHTKSVIPMAAQELSSKVTIARLEQPAETPQAQNRSPPTTKNEPLEQSPKTRALATEDTFHSRNARKRLRPMVRQFNSLKAEYDVIMLAIRQRVYSAQAGSEETAQSPIRRVSLSSTEQVPEPPKITIPSHRYGIEEDLNSRKAIDRFHRIGKRIAQLTAEYKVIVFSIGRQVRFVPSGEDAVEASERPQEVTPPPVQIRRVVAEEDDAPEVDGSMLNDKAPTITPEQMEGTPQPRIRKYPVKVPEVPGKTTSTQLRKLAGDTAFTSDAVDKRLRITGSDISRLTEEQSQLVTQDFLTQVTSAANESARHIGTLQETFELVLGSILLRNFNNPITHQISNIQTTVDILHGEMAKMLRWISLRAHIAHAVNRSALVVYGLNISLRWRLGHMIRNRLPRRHALRSDIHRLESRIFVLRGYRRILLCNRPRLTGQAVREYLELMEMRSKVQKRLAPMMDDKIRDVRRRYQQAKARRQALRNEPIAAGSRVRMTFNSPLVSKNISRRHTVVPREKDSLPPLGNRVYKVKSPRPLGIPRRVSRAIPNKPGRRTTWRRAQRRDEFAARVSSWLAGDLHQVNDNGASTNETK